MTWLMQRSAIEQVESIRASRVDISALEGIEARKPHEMAVKKGGVASIQIKGPLLSQKDDMLDFFGVKYTLYSEIQDQITEAVTRNVNRADLFIDSPGGLVSIDFYDTMKAIAEAPIKTRVVAGNTLASAAFMLATQANWIDAESVMSMVGSFGVLTSGYASGFKKTITNTDSPKKAPDLGTPEGISAVEDELNDVFEIIVEQAAAGRGVSVDTIKSNYGQGAMMTARTALKKKMIDGIIEPESTATKTAAANKETKMDAKTLREEHRDTYDAILATGVQAERDRVLAHLVAAEGGDLNAAHDAIKTGEGYSELVKAKHDAFARKQAMAQARVDDNPDDVEPTDEDHDDVQVQFKKGIEAACPGFEWEVM